MRAPAQAFDTLYLRCGKRAFDVVAALVGLLLFFVPMGVVALLIRVTSGRPLLFTQAGRQGGEGFSPQEVPDHALPAGSR